MLLPHPAGGRIASHVYIAASLDGYIATEGGGIDWLNEIPNPEGSDFGFADFMARIDAVVMGRHTFEKVLTFGAWPYDKPVFVLSSRLTEIPVHLEKRAEILDGPPSVVVDRLHSRGHTELYIDGGRTIQHFLREDLIDEIIITRIPVLLGGGIPLFGDLAETLKFRLLKTETLNDTLVKNQYRRERDG